MKIAIMQPYFFPYVGYFQLINATEKFIMYDDVNFIKQGWINKNSILANGISSTFTLPLENQSSFTKISETYISATLFENWKKKFFKNLAQNYAKAPYYNMIQPIIFDVLQYGSGQISVLNYNIISKICTYLGISTNLVASSSVYNNCDLASSKRIIDICKIEKATVYINLAGGKDLYNKEEFANNGLKLYFISTNEILYKQFNNGFIANLSIIDVLMFNSPKDVLIILNNIKLV